MVRDQKDFFNIGAKAMMKPKVDQQCEKYNEDCQADYHLQRQMILCKQKQSQKQNFSFPHLSVHAAFLS